MATKERRWSHEAVRLDEAGGGGCTGAICDNSARKSLTRTQQDAIFNSMLVAHTYSCSLPLPEHVLVAFNRITITYHAPGVSFDTLALLMVCVLCCCC